MRLLRLSIYCTLAVVVPGLSAQDLVVAGRPSQLDIREAGGHSVRVTLKPLTFTGPFPFSPAVAERSYPAPALSLRSIKVPIKRRIGSLHIEILPKPLTVVVRDAAQSVTIQRLVFQDDGQLKFNIGGAPILGMGEGGPLPARGTPFRTIPIQFDRRGSLDNMQPRWQSDAYGSRNPVAALIGVEGWGLFVATPWVQVDLRAVDHGIFIPWWPEATAAAPQTERNQQQAQGKGQPPISSIVPGLYDVFVFDARDPAVMMREYAVVTGQAVLPPKWALGYMQSHRTLVDSTQVLAVIDSFRSKKIPVDAVIYLGTGFAPRGWNTTQPSFTFNDTVFTRDPKAQIAKMHEKNVKVVVHMVPWDRDKLKTLHGTIPAAKGETLDSSHIQNYWQQHVGLVKSGIDAFWPDEGDWFDLFERVKRHQMYYQGPLSTTPNVRPWSLHRNGFPGIAQWGGWVWSGDTESSWKTLEGQVAVGINYSLSVGPFWGSDIGGFYPNPELTGELYARWYQFAAFCGSFRSHGRDWWTRLPWGWNLGELGPRENGNSHPLATELNNAAIEPAVRKFDELRYQLMPYTYTAAWEARHSGMPLMRAMWLHYSNDPKARGLGTQYLWGRDLLIAPVFEKGATHRDVYLPEGPWYDWWTNAREPGMRTVLRTVDLGIIPIYVRAGAIIPFDPIRQYTSQPVTELTTLRVYRGANGDYTLYEDDGISQEYLKGKGSWTRITWNDNTSTLTLQPGAPKGSSNVVVPKAFRVLLLPEGTIGTVNYVGKSVTVKF